ncbi:MAG: hypothetical protein D6767_00735 [Candidatus Hydrogenedentota bacterium]|nr:MAG: hypothetical protein D6767_00735 [Candidatus Hydrogenedentota bacterium]
MFLRKFVLFTIVFLGIFSTAIYAEELALDPNLKNLRLSGFLRTRYWSYFSESAIDKYDPSKGPKPYEQADYMDLFFRSRFHLLVNRIVSLHSVFDIGTLHLGQTSDTRLGTGGINLKTRNLYMNFRWMKGSPDGIIRIGLMPFSLPRGHILAKDAAGIKIEHRFAHGKVRPYFYFIKAVENSLPNADKFGDFENHNFNDANIYIIGNKFAIGQSFDGEVYYTLLDDKNNGLEDTPPMQRPKLLHWIGLDSRFQFGTYELGFSAIGNFGTIHVLSGSQSVRREIQAGLGEISISKQWTDFSLSLVSVAATGDPSDEEAKDSFQSIGASYGLSKIAVDNSGGLSLRSSGKMYGLNGNGIEGEAVFLGTLSLKLSYYYYLTLRDFIGRKYGQEFNFETTYLLLEKIKFFGSFAMFFPDTGYTTLQNYYKKQPIYEIMFGAQTNY